MAKGVSGKRHAQAVFQIALEERQLDKWQADLDQIAAVLGDPDIAAVLANPKVGPEKKKELLDRGLKGISPTAMKLAQLLVSKNRLHLVKSLAVEYKRLMNAYSGVELAEVTTAVPLEPEEGEKVGRGLSAISGKRVTLELSVKPEILGGFIARLGDKLIDGSARTRLQELRKSIA
ncbi:MAG: ATP synthase F1 subunit delta [Dehalococcoidia bacterium]|nr:ATP synthase F1 subunit delta [Dehalococcoidia bacterium]